MTKYHTMFLENLKLPRQLKLPKQTFPKLNRLAHAASAAANLNANRLRALPPMNTFFTGTVKPRHKKVRMTPYQKFKINLGGLGRVFTAAGRNLTGFGIKGAVKKQRTHMKTLRKLVKQNEQAAKTARNAANIARLSAVRANNNAVKAKRTLKAMM